MRGKNTSANSTAGIRGAAARLRQSIHFYDFRPECLVHAGILLSCNCCVNSVSGSRQEMRGGRIGGKDRKDNGEGKGKGGRGEERRGHGGIVLVT